MSPPPPYRKLQRSRDNRIFGGVCAGAATYLNLDPTLVRVLTVVLSLFTGVPIVLYLLALFLVPEESDGQPPQGPPPVAGAWTYDPYPYPSQAGQSSGQPSYAPGQGSSSAPPRQYGVPPSSEDEAIWGAGGAPWQQPPPSGPAPDPFDGGGPNRS